MAYMDSASSQLSKPYLQLIASVIRSKKPIKFKNETAIIDFNDKNILALLKAIDSKNQSAVNKILKEGKQYSPVFKTTSNKYYTWSQIDKSPFSGMGGKPDGKSTAMQERASMYAIEQGLNKNGYTNKTKFINDCHDQLLKLYPQMDGLWEEAFFQQQMTVAKKVPNNSNFKYSRDDGFMEDITKIVKEFGITKKDTWNPADIWIVENPKVQLKKLDNCKSLGELNTELRTMFKNNIVVGISLKKLSGKEARWEVVNVDLDTFKNDTSFTLGDIRCNLEADGSTDSVITVKNGQKVVGSFQIRQNSTGMANLKVEGTAKGQASARLGKVPLDMLKDLMNDYGLKYNNAHGKYPKTHQAFMAKKDQYCRMYNAIHDKIDSSITKDEFYPNMIEKFNAKAEIAVSKLMQVDLIHEILKLKGQELDDFITSIYFLAQKKGKQFGPFAKLY